MESREQLVQRGLYRAVKADQARQNANARIAGHATDGSATVAADVRLMASTSHHSPQEYLDAYTQPPQP